MSESDPHLERLKSMNEHPPSFDSSFRIGPFILRRGPEFRPHLRTLSDEEAVEHALALMAFSLNRLWESLAIQLKTQDAERIHREMRRLLAQWAQTERRWRQWGEPDETDSRRSHS